MHTFIHTHTHAYIYVHIYLMFQGRQHAMGTAGRGLLTSVGQGVAGKGKRHRGPVQGAGNSGSCLPEGTCQEKVTAGQFVYMCAIPQV